jgi:phage anti-repressor protein
LGETAKGGLPTKTYMLSIDMAKELAMVQRTEKLTP